VNQGADTVSVNFDPNATAAGGGVQLAQGEFIRRFSGTEWPISTRIGITFAGASPDRVLSFVQSVKVESQ